MSNTTNPFTFQVLLDASNINQDEMFYYFHSAVDKNDETNIYELFMEDSEAFEKYQTEQSNVRDLFKNARFIVSCVKTPTPNEAVFVGIYEKSDSPIEDKTAKQFIYKLQKREELQVGSARLFVEYPHLGSGIYLESKKIKAKGGLPITQFLKSK